MGSPLRNIDFLAWFSPEERTVCEGCGRQACVTLPDAEAWFCLACGAVSIGGKRVDIDGCLPPDG